MYTKHYPDHSLDKMVVYATAYGDITPVTPKCGGKPYDRLQVMLRRSSHGTRVSLTPCRLAGPTVACTVGPDRNESGFCLTLKPDAGYDARLVRDAKRLIRDRLGEIAHAFDVGNDGEKVTIGHVPAHRAVLEGEARNGRNVFRNEETEGDGDEK